MILSGKTRSSQRKPNPCAPFNSRKSMWDSWLTKWHWDMLFIHNRKCYTACFFFREAWAKIRIILCYCGLHEVGPMWSSAFSASSDRVTWYTAELTSVAKCFAFLDPHIFLG